MNSNKSYSTVYRAFCSLFLILSLSACVTNQITLKDLTVEQRQSVGSIKLFGTEASPPATAKKLENISGYACIREHVSYFRFSEATARQNLIYRAAQMNASAVYGVTCKKTGTDYSTNCWASHVCSGDAFKTTGG